MRLIKSVQCRLKILKSRKFCNSKQSREDIAQLINTGHEDIALRRAEDLFRDEAAVSVYELLESFCEFIICHLKYIRKNKECPDDINEAVSSLIYASTRCGNLPELRVIRKLFGERYSNIFEMTALELLPGNLVNSEVKEKLSIASVPDDIKHKLVQEIAIKCASELQQQAVENGSIIEQKGAYMPSENGHCDDVKYSSDINELPTRDFKVSKGAGKACSSTPVRNKERKVTAASCESIPQFPEEMIVYFDDIEEVKHSIVKGDSCQDLSISKFKSTMQQKGVDLCFDSCELRSNYSSTGSTRKRVNAAIKPSKRRSLSIESASVNDIHSLIYYEKPYKRSVDHGSHVSDKHLRKHPKESNKQSGISETRQNPQSYPHFNPGAENFCLNSSCLLCTIGGRDKLDSANSGQHTKTRSLARKHRRKNSKSCETAKVTRESNTKMEQYALPPRPRRRRCDFGANRHDCQSDKEMKTTKCEAKGFDVPARASQVDTKESACKTTIPVTRQPSKPPYVRAITMPQERPKENSKENVSRHSMSLPAQSPHHVHPKLPDYDELSARFLALKKEHLQNKS